MKRIWAVAVATTLVVGCAERSMESSSAALDGAALATEEAAGEEDPVEGSPEETDLAAYAAAMAASAETESADAATAALWPGEDVDPGAAYAAEEARLAAEEAQRHREEVDDARRAVVGAQQDLQRSVRSLSYNDWENDLPTVQRRLRALEDANQQLAGVDAAAASSMDFEIGRMKREMRRLEDENWQEVVPDVERRSRAIGWEADSMEGEIEY